MTRKITYAVESMPTQYRIVRIANGSITPIDYGTMKSCEDPALALDHAKELAEAESRDRRGDADLTVVVDCRKRDPERMERVRNALLLDRFDDVSQKDMVDELKYRSDLHMGLSELAFR